MAMPMRILRLDVPKIRNHLQVLVAKDPQIELVTELHPTDQEMLLRSNLHNLLLDQLIQTTDG
jgi:hypothetical protein